MKTIYKYVLKLEDEQTIRMPNGAQILYVAIQHASVTMWVRIDTDNEPRNYRIFCRGTGHPFSGDEGRHIGTVFIHDGALVFHYFAEAGVTA